MKLSEYHKVLGTYKTYISDLFISMTLGQVIFATSPLGMSIKKYSHIFTQGRFCEWNHNIKRSY